MMKTLISVLAAITMLAGSAGAQHLSRLPGVVFASDRGAREATTLNDIISAVGAKATTVVLDGSMFAIDEAVNFPTNVAVVVLPGSGLYVYAGITATIRGPLIAGDYAIFGGSGGITGPASFGYRYTAWGDTNSFNIGAGYLVAQSSLMLQDAASREFSTWYTNTACNSGGFINAYAVQDATSAVSLAAYVTTTNNTGLYSPFTYSKSSGVTTSQIVSVSAPVPYMSKYMVTNVGGTNSTGFYFTGMMLE